MIREVIKVRIAYFRIPMMMFLTIMLILMSVLIARPSVTYACSCAISPDPLKAVENSSAVFTGEVVDMKKSQGQIISSADPVEVTFKVDASWKGEVGNEVTVTTALSSVSCGYEFVEGESYLVYAYSREGDESNQLGVGLCSRTMRLASASADLKELESKFPSNVPTASPEVNSNGSPESSAADPEEYLAESSPSSPLVKVGIIGGAIIVLIAIVSAAAYRKTRKK